MGGTSTQTPNDVKSTSWQRPHIQDEVETRHPFLYTVYGCGRQSILGAGFSETVN